jgi:type III secretory pathway component EscR
MKDFIVKLFGENGSISMMRVMSLLSLFAGIGTSFVGLSKPIVDYSGIALLVSVFLSAAFGGKVMQKRIEIDGAKSTSEVDTPSHPDPKAKPRAVDNPD